MGRYNREVDITEITPVQHYGEVSTGNAVAEMGLIALIIAVLVVGGYFGWKYYKRSQAEP